MNDMQIFRNNDFGEIRTLEENGTVLFCGNDVAKALGYARPNDAVSTHCRATVKRSSPISGKMQEINFIPEGDVYRLIVRSKLPSAEKFEHWVFDDILPTIRKHGAYMTPETLEQAVLNPDYLLKVVTALKNETDKRKALEVTNSALTVDLEIARPKAEYFDALVDRNLLTSIRETAKQLEVKERDFVAFLIEKKYLYRDKKGKLMPYAGRGDGLFEVKECINETTQWSGTQTMITPKGRETFRMLLVGCGIS